MKKLKLGDIVEAVFLGEVSECEVIEITDKQLYKLRMKSGTILPSVTWKKLLIKDKPWHIVKYLKHNKSKVIEKEKVQKVDLDKAIQKQKHFIRGNIKE